MQQTQETTYDSHHLEAVKRKIDKDGIAFITVAPLLGAKEHGHHYTIGLTEQGYPEIFLSGRLDNQVAYAIMEKIIKIWKNRGSVKTGLFNGIIRLGNNYMADAFVYQVDTSDAIEKNATFLDMMRAMLPKAHQNVVQVLWPDTRGRLPNNPGYEKHIDFRQVQLPEMTGAPKKEEMLPPVMEVPKTPFDYATLTDWIGHNQENVLPLNTFEQAMTRANCVPTLDNAHFFTAFTSVKDNILTVDFDCEGKENGKAQFEIERETRQLLRMVGFKGPKSNG